MIHTWAGLEKHLGFDNDTIKRWIKLYGFPAPERVGRDKAKGVYWSRSEVEAWLSINTEMVDKVRGHRGRFKIFDPELILVLAARANSAGEVASILGCSKKTVWATIRKHKGARA